MIFDIDLKKSDSIALKEDSGQIMTYGELAKVMHNHDDFLPVRSLVIVLANNDIATVSFILSCLEKKWVPLVINKDTDEALVDGYINKYKPNAIFTNSKEASYPTFGIVCTISWLDKHVHVFHEHSQNLFPELSFLLPTSGSTGSPKLVRHSYENLTFSASNVSAFFKITCNDVGLAILPIYYTMGFSVLTSHLFAGAQVVLSNYPLTDRGFWEVLKNDNITILTGVPYTFEVLFKMRFERVKVPTLRIVTQGGGKLSDDLWDKLVTYAERNSIQFIPTYGQTEGTARMAYLDSEYTTSKKGSIGKAIPNGVFEVWDESGAKIDAFEAEGQLVYKGGNVTLGYAENAEDLRKGDERLGILPTGDIVRRDVDGFYYIIGRSKRFLKIFGLRISLDEVELLLKNNFQVDCYCSGTDDFLHVFIDREDILNEVKHWLSAKINLFHQAIEVKYIDKIPRNSSGKVVFTA